MDNIGYFSEYCSKKNNRFSLAMCVMRQNWQELPEFINFCNSMNAVATFHKVWYPLQHALHNLPVDKLNEIYEYLEPFDFPEQTPLQIGNKNHYKYILSCR